MNKNLRTNISKSIFLLCLGKVTLDLAQLPNRTTTEEWYELKAVEKGSGKGKPSPLGTLRLRVKYQVKNECYHRYTPGTWDSQADQLCLR